MGHIVCLHDKAEVEAFARGTPFLHIYEIGDLDDFFWPHTTWYALLEDDRVRQLALLYADLHMPVLLAYGDEPLGLMRDLLQGLLPLLPRRFYAHLDATVVEVLSADYNIHCHGSFRKMGLLDPSRPGEVTAGEAVALSGDDLQDLQALYRDSYPGHWFVPRMLETGFYFGLRRNGELVSVAGVHVYSRRYKVAALGNITTRPDHRGQGLATIVTARLCQELLHAGVEHIGLNVRADNSAAVTCYEKLSFQPVAEYGEYTLELK